MVRATIRSLKSEDGTEDLMIYHCRNWLSKLRAIRCSTELPRARRCGQVDRRRSGFPGGRNLIICGPPLPRTCCPLMVARLREPGRRPPRGVAGGVTPSITASMVPAVVVGVLPFVQR